MFAVSEQIVPRVLQQLIQLVSDEFLSYIREVEVFGYNGVLYVGLDNKYNNYSLVPWSILGLNCSIDHIDYVNVVYMIYDCRHARKFGG